MDKEKYYIVTEGDAPAIEAIPSINGKAVILCEQPDLAEEGENLEPITYGDLPLLLQDRDDIQLIRIRTYGGAKLIEKPDFLGEMLSS